LSLVGKSHAQLLQDVFACLMSNEKHRGYFVEVGVGDGVWLSNTKMLERDYQWSGLLVEPNRDSHASIRAHRTAKLAVEAAYAKGGQNVTFSSRTDVGEFSGISSHLESSRKTENSRIYDVVTSTLDDLLTAANAPSQIDFISIDTEGSELEVLEGLSLDRWKVTAFAIEHNHHPAKILALDNRLIPLGYRRVFSDVSQFDAWYIHDSCNSRFL
jgi:FkbM family methyltransferase